MKVSEILVHHGPNTDKYYGDMTGNLLTTTHEANRPIMGHAITDTRFVDIDGNMFIDLTSQICPGNTGLLNEDIRSAVYEQMRLLPVCLPNDFQFRTAHKRGYLKGREVSNLALARELKRITPVPAPKIVGLETDGGKAVILAARLCLFRFLVESGVFSRSDFAAFADAFHGRPGIAGDLTAKEAQKLLQIKSKSVNVLRLDFPRDGINYDGRYREDIARIFDLDENRGKICAVFVETVQGEGGLNFASPIALGYIQEVVGDRDILFVADEIQTGLGRTGKMFDSERLMRNPDMVITSKALGGGLPISAVVCRNDEKIIPGGDIPVGAASGTMCGAPVPNAAAQAVIKFTEENDLVGNSHRVGECMVRELEKRIWRTNAGRDAICRIEGRGLMIAVEFRKRKTCKAVVRAAAAQRPLGLLLIEAGQKTIRLEPPLTIKEQEAEKGIELLVDAIKAANS